MSIIRLAKVTLIGAAEQKGDVLDGLQHLGCVHLLSLRPGEERLASGPAMSIEAVEALKYLQSCPVQRRPVREATAFDFKRVVSEALEIERHSHALRDERDHLEREIERQEPWGEFKVPPAEQLGGLRLWFYVVPHYRMRQMEKLNVAWQSVARDPRYEYVAVISQFEPQGMPVPRVDLDPRSLTELRSRLNHVEDELEDLHWRRVVLTRWIWLLEQTLTAAADRDLREQAARQTLDAGRLFAVQGWAAEDDLPPLREFARQHALAITHERPGPDEQPPTLLRNPEVMAGGEEAVKFYMTPGYHMWDPSLVVFFSFSLFFAMILADAGYALLMAVVILLFWRRMGSTPTGVRLRTLAATMAVFSMVYGAVVGSYFGRAPRPETWLGAVHILDPRDLNVMMPLSILLGVLHVALAVAMMGWRVRGTQQMLSPVGWEAILAAGVAIGVAMSGMIAESHADLVLNIGYALLIVGALLVLLFSGTQPVRSWKGLAVRLADGLKSLTNISQAFGDVLSYLRLFALGLASTQLALTFNDLSDQAYSHPALGVLLGTLVLIVGHGFNFLLSTLSGVVHGLRLNCIEFFKWGLPEEGYPFRPFSRKAEV